jgi:hypothetical protein
MIISDCFCGGSMVRRELKMFIIMECLTCNHYEFLEPTELNLSLQREQQELYEITNTEGLPAEGA